MTTSQSDKPSLWIRIALPVITLVVLVGIARTIAGNPPERERRGDGGPPLLLVEAMTLQSRDYDVVLESYGTVQPRTRSRLVAQVGGQILSISPAFLDGAFFKAGDVLAQIDPRDYRADVSIAQAALLDARQALADAEARSAQAIDDWRRLGNAGAPPPLVAREPQRRAAEARVASAQAALEKAELALERTRIVAPYDGRVLSHDVDVGQVVAANTVLGEIYETESVEVRLPLRNRDLGFIELPDAAGDNVAPGSVELVSELDGASRWRGTLVRTDSEIDPVTRQLHVTARLDDPYASGDGRMPIKIGQYVTAHIGGRTIEDAIIVPNRNIYQGAFVYVVDDAVTTQLGQVTSGTRVTVVGAAARDRIGAQAAPDAGASVPGALSQ